MGGGNANNEYNWNPIAIGRIGRIDSSERRTVCQSGAGRRAAGSETPGQLLPITIYIQDDEHVRFGLRVLSSDTISQVKEKIQVFIFGHKRWCACLQLYYCGEQLEDESQLQKCSIFNMSTLDLVPSLSDIQRWSEGR